MVIWVKESERKDLKEIYKQLEDINTLEWPLLNKDQVSDEQIGILVGKDPDIFEKPFNGVNSDVVDIDFTFNLENNYTIEEILEMIALGIVQETAYTAAKEIIEFSTRAKAIMNEYQIDDTETLIKGILHSRKKCLTLIGIRI